MEYQISCDELLSNHEVLIDEACINVINSDQFNTYDVWAQSEECFTCSPWKYFSLNPRSNAILKVNSTYLTNLEIYQKYSIIYEYKYHFAQHGIYSVEFNSSHSMPIITQQQGNNEYAAILAAFLFFIFLYIFWITIQALQRKLEEGRFHSFRNENVNLLSDNETVSQNESELESTNATRAEPISSSSTSSRLHSLDTFRGIAITIMIFVNYRGGKYYFFNHSPWNGLTVADLVFPWFLWIMGVSLIFSIKSQLRNNTSYYSIFAKILKRSVILFALGIVVNSLHSNKLATFRIFGVLQRFSLCYFVNAVMEMCFIHLPVVDEPFRCFWLRDLLLSKVQWGITGLLVFIHMIISFYLPIPGCSTGYLGPGGLHEDGNYSNCTGGTTGYIDRLILGEKHMYAHPSCKLIYDSFIPFDPEGIFGVLTSCLTVQLGVAAGRIILYYPHHYDRLKRWIIWGVILGLLGGFLCGYRKEGGFIPVNKNLWSLSYVFVTASFAFFLLSFLYYGIDVNKKWSGSIFRLAGMNSILLYVGHEITKSLFPWSWSPLPKTHSGILFMSVWGTFLWLTIAAVCHKKKFYLNL